MNIDHFKRYCDCLDCAISRDKSFPASRGCDSGHGTLLCSLEVREKRIVQSKISFSVRIEPNWSKTCSKKIQ